MLIAVILVMITAFVTYLITNKINKASFDIYEIKAKAKAKAIEYESNTEIKNSYDKLEKEKENLEKQKQDIQATKAKIEEQKLKYQNDLEQMQRVLEKTSKISMEEAKHIMIEMSKELSKNQIAGIYQKEYQNMKKDIKTKANNLLLNVTSRYSHDFVATNLFDNIDLEDDSIRGKLIGKDGRNIKALQTILGVDIIVDNKLDYITVSCFNLYRREVAIKTIKKLIRYGKINPARIEDTLKSVKEEFDDDIFNDGVNTLHKMGITNMNDEFVYLLGKLKYRTSYGQNALSHTIEVANLSGLIAGQLDGDIQIAKRAGLLHDIGKALTQETGENHVDIGADLAKKHNEPDEVINAIYAHHEYEEPKYVESYAVCIADTLSAGRVGARRETLGTFIKRVEQIEEICNSKSVVQDAFAIDGAREVRVLVKSNLIDDEQSAILSSQLASEIASVVNYPGEIKINVIREHRAVSYAKH
ncbi:MAG: ribonuclease Y [Campylobacteraceae bacterium 4484_166]|nr:MAG: ribonuclease Y [Campylobacteraceae bacterium 4484_166]